VSKLVGFLLLLIVLFTVAQLAIQIIRWVVKKSFPSWKEQLPAKLTSDNVLEIFQNIVVGLIVAIMIHLYHTYPVIMDIEDASMDLVMQIGEGILPSKESKKEPQFVILDIDEETHKDWGYPPFTPRNHLKTLIDTAVQAEAQLVIVDIDLSQETPFKELQKLEEWRGYNGELRDNEKKLLDAAKGFVLHPFDEELYDYIDGYSRRNNCESNQTSGQSGCVPIILVGPPLEKIGTEDLGKILRIGFLAKAVEKSKPYIQWGTAIFKSSPDQVERRVVLWHPVCSVDDQTERSIIPSVVLLVANWFLNKPTKEILASEQGVEQFESSLKVSKHLKIFSPSEEECVNRQYSRKFPDYLKIGGLTINLEGDSSKRVIYSMPWGSMEEAPELPYRLCHTLLEREECVLEILKAGNFVQTAYGPPRANSKPLKGKIVIIGGSYRYDGKKGDIHSTPLGNMLGATLLSNAIYSLLQLEMKPMDWWLKLSLDAVSILLMSLLMMSSRRVFFVATVVFIGLVIYLFFEFNMEAIMVGLCLVVGAIIATRLLSFLKVVFSAIFIGFLLLWGSVSLFEGRGIWLEFTIPLIAVIFHQIVDIYEKANEKANAINVDFCEKD